MKNPVLGAFSESYEESGRVMSLNGTAFRTFILLVITALSAYYVWHTMSPQLSSVEVMQQQGYMARLSNVPSPIYTYLLTGCIGGLILGIVISFTPRIAFLLSPIYALLEGLCLGSVSLLYAAAYGGPLVFQAIFLTFGVSVAMLGLYLTRIVRPTERFKAVILSAMIGICLFYLISIGIQCFSDTRIPMLESTGIWGIGFSLVVVVIAAANLVIDFEFIENGIKTEAPQYLEWYAGFSLLVTLVWLYLEILRLLAKTQGKK